MHTEKSTPKTLDYLSIRDNDSATRLWPRTLIVFCVAIVLALFVLGCKSNNAAATTANGTDPAAANLAPVDNSGQPAQVLGQSASYAPQQQSQTYEQQAPAPIVQGSDTTDYSYNNTEDAGEQAVEQTDQPPPPLPNYDQPPAPEDDYLWTPGYWAWGPGGYYWVPGAWCPPPYYGALWTPPYWGWYGGHYRFHHGYWGPHVGFYGGINYGFGYIGIGYFGGYWRGNDFYYNRSVNNVGHANHVYNREVVYNNVHYSAHPDNRVSYNGGRGGINVAPRPAEVAAMHESHARPVEAQTQMRQQAAGDKQQFFNQNHGRPAQVAVARPAGVTGPAHIAAAPPEVRQVQQRDSAIQQRNAPAANHPNPAVENRPGTARPPEPVRGQPVPSRPGVENHTQAPPQARPTEQPRPQPQGRPTEQPQPQTRPQPQARPIEQARPQPQAQPRPQPQTRPQPAPQPREQAAPRPAPAARPAPEARPAPAPRPAPAAAPRPTPQARPAPAPRPAEAPHAEGERPH